MIGRRLGSLGEAEPGCFGFDPGSAKLAAVREVARVDAEAPGPRFTPEGARKRALAAPRRDMA